MKQEREFNALVESFENGNYTFVMDKVMKFRKKKLIGFFYYLNINSDIFDTNKLVNAIHNRTL